MNLLNHRDSEAQSQTTNEWGCAPAAQRWYRYTRFVIYAGVISVLFFSGMGGLFWPFVIPAVLLGMLGELPALRSRWSWARFFGPSAWYVAGAGFLWNVFAYHHVSLVLWGVAAVIFVAASAPVWVLTTLKCPNCGEPFFRRQPPKWDAAVNYPLTSPECATCKTRLGQTGPTELGQVKESL